MAIFDPPALTTVKKKIWGAFSSPIIDFHRI